MTAPLALFYHNNKKQLTPVAIQLFQQPAEDNPVYYPSDEGYLWLLVKMWYDKAEVAYHQNIAHLGKNSTKACSNLQVWFSVASQTQALIPY